MAEQPDASPTAAVQPQGAKDFRKQIIITNDLREHIGNIWLLISNWMSRNFQEFFLAREGKQRMGSVNGDIVERAKVSCELVELAKVPCELVELAKVPCESDRRNLRRFPLA